MDARRQPRTPEALRAHFEVERELAASLRGASKADRRRLYTEVYDELFQRVPDHPQLTRVRDARSKAEELSRQFALLRRFLRPDLTFLEIGAGDCPVSLEVARHVRRVYAVDVSDKVAPLAEPPANLRRIISDGSSIDADDVPPGSVDLVYSNQLMEHLHPDDASDQLDAIVRAMAPGGCYLCVTPNRLCGPHDISSFFGDEAVGLHLREYTLRELTALFRQAGLSHARVLLSYQGAVIPFLLPVFPFLCLESLLARLSWPARRQIGRVLLAAKLVARR